MINPTPATRGLPSSLHKQEMQAPGETLDEEGELESDSVYPNHFV